MRRGGKRGGEGEGGGERGGGRETVTALRCYNSGVKKGEWIGG